MDRSPLFQTFSVRSVGIIVKLYSIFCGRFACVFTEKIDEMAGSGKLHFFGDLFDGKTGLFQIGLDIVQSHFENHFAQGHSRQFFKTPL